MAEKLPRFAFTEITSDDGPVNKSFSLDKSGNLEKANPNASIFKGAFRVVEVDDLEGYLEYLEATECAVTYGVPNIPAGALRMAERWNGGVLENQKVNKSLGQRTRTKADFTFRRGEPGFLMLDYDRPRDGSRPLSMEEFEREFRALHPLLEGVKILFRPSSSSHIYRDDGFELLGEGSYRAYVGVTDASLIPALGNWIYQQSWKRGHGRIEISRSARPLDRGLVDRAVFEAQRLDFVASPTLGPGLRREKRPGIITGALDRLNSAQFMQVVGAPVAHSKWKHTSAEWKRLLKSAGPDIEAAQNALIESRVEELGEGARERVVAFVKNCNLTCDTLVELADGRKVTVAEILRDVRTYGGMRIPDPLEPGYNNDRRIAEIHLEGDRPHIYSYAHGGAVYRLLKTKRELSRNKAGTVHANARNIELVLEHLGVSLAYDEFRRSLTIEQAGAARVPLTDRHLDTLWMEAQKQCDAVFPERTFNKGIMALGYGSASHPARDAVSGLVWDGVQRCDTMLIEYCGANDTEYNRIVSRKFLIMLVRRLFHPGCLARWTLILEGAQSIGKSGILKIMALNPDWHSDNLHLLDAPQKIIEQSAGVWVAEMADLSKFRNTYTADLWKAAISTTHDVARAAWGRIAERVPRGFVPVGTYNPVDGDGYLPDDPTGNTRYVPVKVFGFKGENGFKMLFRRLEIDMPAILAEAKTYVDAGESHDLPESLKPVATAEAAEREQVDPWKELIADRIDKEARGGACKVRGVTVLDWLGVPMERQDRKAQGRVARIMMALGFKRIDVKLQGRNLKMYVKAPDGEAPMICKTLGGDGGGGEDSRPEI